MRQSLDSANGAEREVWLSQAVHQEAHSRPHLVEARSAAQPRSQGSTWMGLAHEPKKAAYHRVYKRMTVGCSVLLGCLLTVTGCAGLLAK
jgi:hypothetical protein